MKQAGFEKDRPVLTIRQNQGLSYVMCQKRYSPILVGIIIPDLPSNGWWHAANGHSATVWIEIGDIRRNPKIDADHGIVCMCVNRGTGFKAFEGPCLGERVPP